MNKQKFTLIELMVVISIIAILAGILVPALDEATQTPTNEYRVETEHYDNQGQVSSLEVMAIQRAQPISNDDIIMYASESTGRGTEQFNVASKTDVTHQYDVMDGERLYKFVLRIE